MDLENKIVLAHKGFASSKSKDTYKENSIGACKESSDTDYISIIELDVRKSKDNILYCYHGTLLQYCTTLKLSKNLAAIQNQYAVSTLSDILEIISSNKILLLDIKDTSITKEDIAKVFKDKTFKEVILGNKSVRYLNRFTDMPDSFVKILNGNLFSNFYNLDELKKKGFKYFAPIFSFQLTTGAFSKVEKSVLMFRISGVGFITKKSYWRKINKYNITHVSSDFI